ncbi:MAG: rhomboid family intramembrane serine protease [Erysipelotrichaceae bacterium]|nr:rhomboid family intramembrane serine protease [Erysipelotrichaceae bacterium]
MADSYYKLYQVGSIFISLYSYLQINIKKYENLKETEAWFANPDNEHYQLIRVSFNEAESFIYDAKRVEEYLAYMKAYAKKDIRFLDIHLSTSKHNEEFEPYDYLNIEENYADGINVRSIYPEIYSSIHTVNNQNKEMSDITNKVISSLKKKRKQILKERNRKAYVTLTVMGICTIMQILSYIMSSQYSQSSVLIFLGALYNTFTLGFNQYFRLITYAFLHAGFLHFFFNMYALFGIGVFLENNLGHKKYALLLFGSILAGGLTQGIICENTICIGISGGIYGLFVVYIAILLANHVININQLLPTILINLMLNFMSATAWAAHLGGAIVGFIFFYIMRSDGNSKKGYIALVVIMLVVLTAKYVFFTEIDPFYLGTDQEVLNLMSDIGLKSYADKLYLKLFEIYLKYKGV